MTKRSINQALVLGLLLAWPAGSPADELKPASPIGSGYRLAWHDEFDGDRLDTGKWTYRIDTRFWSMQRAENVSVADGCLRLALKKERQGELEYTADGVISRETFQYLAHQRRAPLGGTKSVDDSKRPTVAEFDYVRYFAKAISPKTSER